MKNRAAARGASIVGGATKDARFAFGQMSNGNRAITSSGKTMKHGFRTVRRDFEDDAKAVTSARGRRAVKIASAIRNQALGTGTPLTYQWSQVQSVSRPPCGPWKIQARVSCTPKALPGARAMIKEPSPAAITEPISTATLAIAA